MWVLIFVRAGGESEGMRPCAWDRDFLQGDIEPYMPLPEGFWLRR